MEPLNLEQYTAKRSTVGKQLEYMAEKYPDKIAFSFPEENVKFTFRQTVEYADKVAKALLGSGIKKGDHIAVWSTNCSQWLFVLLGAATIGAPVVPINCSFIGRELEYTLSQSDTKMLFYMPKYRKQSTEGILSEVQIMNSIQAVNLGTGDALFPGWDHFMSKGEEVTDESLIAAAESVSGEDIYSIQFTSGTTSLPKGAILNHSSVLGTASSFSQRFHITEKDVLAVPLPMFHVFGNVLTTLCCIVTGGCAVYQSAFSPSALLKILENERCTTFMGVPTMYLALINQPDFSKYDLSHLAKGGIGGSYCSPSVAEFISRKLDINLSVGYGMSECASLCAVGDMDEPESVRLHSAGRPMDGLEISIRDLDTNAVVPSGGTGEIMVRGRCLMKGYYNSPEATRKALTPDGWLHTGDVGHIDENGSLHVTGRIKDIIIRGGENISPSEIEDVLLEIEAVKSVCCVGVRDDVYGEEIAALVIPKEGMPIVSEEIRNYAKAHLASFKVPRYVFSVEEFPLNGSGKVIVSKLQELAEQLVKA